MSLRPEALLVDSGFFFVLFDARDSYHNDAIERQEYLEVFSLVIPWLIIYVTFNTRFSRRPKTVSRFERALVQPHAALLDDTNYRREAFGNAYILARSVIAAVSLIVAFLSEILNDVNIRIHGMLTFNHRGCARICHANGVTIV